MKKLDLRKSVMDKVTGFERRRSGWWFMKFGLVMVALLSLLGGLLWFLIQVLTDRQAWELLTIFTQDPEIIKDYWQDTLWVFWEEMPHRLLVVAGVVILGIVLFTLVTHRKRKIMQKRIGQLAKYR
jgi:hypothetical protein